MQRIENLKETPEQRLKRIIENADAIIAEDPGYPFEGTSVYRSLRREHKAIYGDVFARLMEAERDILTNNQNTFREYPIYKNYFLSMQQDVINRGKLSTGFFGPVSPLKLYQILCMEFGRTISVSHAVGQRGQKIEVGSKSDIALREPIINQIKSLFTPEEIQAVGDEGVNGMINDMINYATNEYFSINPVDLILRVFTTNLGNFFAKNEKNKLFEQAAEKNTMDLVADAFKKILRTNRWRFDGAMVQLSDLEIAHFANMITRKFNDLLMELMNILKKNQKRKKKLIK